MNREVLSCGKIHAVLPSSGSYPDPAGDKLKNAVLSYITKGVTLLGSGGALVLIIGGFGGLIFKNCISRFVPYHASSL